MNINTLQRYMAAAKPWVLAQCYGHEDGCSCNWCRLEEEVSDAEFWASRIVDRPLRRFRVRYRHEGGPVLRESDWMTREQADEMARNLSVLWRYVSAEVVEGDGEGELDQHGGSGDGVSNLQRRGVSGPGDAGQQLPGLQRVGEAAGATARL